MAVLEGISGMNRFQTFEQFVTSGTTDVPLWGFILNLLLTAAFAYMLQQVYIKHGSSLSNRRMFARNFVLLAMTTMLVISIVKSSLALSLGLVGALSIVRFRSAIKEPEELLYLFLAIGLGLGFGAGQRVITILAFLLICIVIGWGKRRSEAEKEMQNLCLTVTAEEPQKVTLEAIVEVLTDSCSGVNLRRFDETKGVIEASFVVEVDDFAQLNNLKNQLRELSDSMKISFLDNKGIL